MDVGQVLARKELNEGILNCPCTRKHRNDIAQHITNWQALAPFLDLSSGDEEEIDEEKSVKAKRIALLRKWSHNKGEEATYLDLMKGFAKMGRVDLIEKLCDIFNTDTGLQGASRGAHKSKGFSPSYVIEPFVFLRT